MEEHNSFDTLCVNEPVNDFVCDPNSDLTFDVSIFSEFPACSGPNTDLPTTDASTLSSWDVDMLVWDFNSNSATLEQKKAVANMLRRNVSFIDSRLTVLRKISLRLSSVVLSLADRVINNLWKLYVDKKQNLCGKPCPTDNAIDENIVMVLALTLRIDKGKLQSILTHIRDVKHYLHFAGIHRDTVPVPVPASSVPFEMEFCTQQSIDSALPMVSPISNRFTAIAQCQRYTIDDDVTIWSALEVLRNKQLRDRPTRKKTKEKLATALNRTESGIAGRLSQLRSVAAQAARAVDSGMTLRVGEQCNLWRLYSQRVWPPHDNSTHVDERVIGKLAEKLCVSHSTLRAELQNIRSIKWYLLLVGIHSDRRDTSPCNEPTCAEKVEPLPTHETSSEYGTDNAWSPKLAFLVWFGTLPPFVFKLQDEVELWRIYVEHQHDPSVNICARLQELSQQLGCQFAQAREHLSKLVKLSNGDDAQQHSAGRSFTTAEDNIILTSLRYTSRTLYVTALLLVSQRLSFTMGAVAARHKQLKTISALQTVCAEVDTVLTKNKQCVQSEDAAESSENEGNCMFAYFSTECESSDEEMMH